MPGSIHINLCYLLLSFLYLLAYWLPGLRTQVQTYTNTMHPQYCVQIFQCKSCPPPSPIWQGSGYNRGPSDHTGDSDNTISFWHHSDITNGRNIDHLGGDPYWKLMNGVVGILTDKPFAVRIPWVSLGGTGLTLTSTLPQ